jgi:UDP-glucose 4-epimerase
MKVLVTGAAGYIGSICAELLLARGHNVVALDNLSKGHLAAVPPTAKFYNCDICDRAALDRVFAAEAPEAVMHFAALSVVPESVENPGLYYAVNVAGASAARRVTGHPIPTRDAPRRAGDPPVLVASCDRIRREMGWQPRHSDLDRMVASAWAWRQKSPLGYPPRGTC